MPIITISRGSYSKGKEIAERVGEELGYDVISRDVLLEASDHFNIPEVKLVHALHDAPGVLNRFTHGREKYVAFIRMAFLEKVQKGDVVYHGLAGHFFVKDVAHVLKVRIIADMEDRIRWEMQRKSVSEEKARSVLVKDDQERRKWSQSLYGIDTADSSLYDLVIHIRKFSVEDAVSMIAQAARLDQYRETPESRKAIDDLTLASQVQSTIVETWPSAQVSADDGEVYVDVKAPLTTEPALVKEITKRASVVPNVKTVRVNVRPMTLYMF